MTAFTELLVEELSPGSELRIAAGDTVAVHYTGRLTDGTVFDSSYERGEPIELPVGVGMVIEGWDKGLVGLAEGGKYRLSIPSAMGYGAHGAGDAIPPNADLVFDVEVVKIVKADARAASAGFTELGVEELVPGSGQTVAAGDTVAVHYTGSLTDGTVFDSSYERGEPIEVKVGAGMVIEGWDKGLLGLVEGGKYRLSIPSAMGYGPYGAGGVIPPNADLVFDVEIVKVTKPETRATTPAFTGLGVEELIPGTGRTVAAGDTVAVHYTGSLTDGTIFDSSYTRGEPIEVKVGAGMVIEGWDKGLLGLVEGGKYRLSIPSAMGYGPYGAGGVIPPNADLVFEVEIVGIR